ncbi:GTP binding protein [Desarmillaria tabescens]|uniref:GTP binding protein n=1 Tax=Armillaria tabescens TaxID=1929756 RepID=A0AA39NEP5_ARMTA|nr:GTP binding protein [Desarmillaria tabescens]KAK0464275.1 GTP binding protein [Desarmillaria tabescens]
MMIAEHRIQDERAGSAAGSHLQPSLALPSHVTHVGSGLDAPAAPSLEFTLLVAGSRGGKTSFLRLLLDTFNVSHSATQDQLTSVAKFVQGCSGRTSHIRSASIDVVLDLDGNGPLRTLTLHLVDTPSLDFRDEQPAERLVADTLRYVESRFAESIEDDRNPSTTDRYVHLCLYFLDPDQIVPSQIPAPLAPPRARANSFSQPDHDPLILELPVANNPLLTRPTLPSADINTIRRLSTRVNVLPVVSRADILSNDRLAAVKMAIRRDLAAAGIGFGIFDDAYHSHPGNISPSNGELTNGYVNGTSSATSSPPSSPVTSSLRLPYALISPDIYSHSDGVPRIPMSRQQLVHQYTPSYHSPPKLVRGKYIRSYRWGSLDVLDPCHCDFLHLRNAIFHHMETLQTYTRDYLFDKFKLEYLQTSRPSLSRHLVQNQGISRTSGAISSRPILAIDTAGPHNSISRHHSLSVSRDASASAARDMRPTLPRPLPDISVSASTKGLTKAKQRTKKITVACNFCRSRKLKCDGGRPACSQCVKRSNSCDYMPQSKRRGGMRTSRDRDSGSDSADEPSPDALDTPVSEVPSLSISRRTSNAGSMTPLPSLGVSTDASTSSVRSKGSMSESRSYWADNELPHIATLSLPERSPATPVPMSAPPLPPIRPASEHQAAQRKRAATTPGKSGRQPSTSGPKVVACNFCRARKTKCDGAHPACSSCVRRNLLCNYVNDRNGGDPLRKAPKRASNARPSPPSPPSSRMVPTPLSAKEENDYALYVEGGGEYDVKRMMEHPDINRPSKKMRIEGSSIAVDAIP